MKRFGPHVRLELCGGSPQMRYLPRAGQEELLPIKLHPLLAVVLASLDEGWSEEELTQHLARRLANPPATIREIVTNAWWCFKKHFAHEGDGSFVDLGERERLLQGLADGRLYRDRDVVLRGDRAPFPLTLQWLVTRYCNRNCIYCYQGATPSARAVDAEISCRQVCDILRQGARLGAGTFSVTGGEPLLRADIYDILVYALEVGLTPKIITKQFIPQDAVDRLAAAGLRYIALSIDSLDPAVAARMTQVRTYARDIAKTAQRLVARGVTVEARVVLTTENLDALPQTLEELERLGVSRVRIYRYEVNLKRHSDTLIPSDEQVSRLRDWIERLQANGSGDMKVTLTDTSAPAEPPEDLGEDCIVCNNGITSLLFLPDGRVSRCDKPLPGTDFVVGDLTRQSVQEVWNCPEMLASLQPSRELYRGTLCYDCGYFDVCHERGRCFYSAYLASGTLYGPQENCPYLGKGSLQDASAA